MLGLECVMRPVTAPLGLTYPCTLPSSVTASNQLCTCAIRFCIIRYSPIKDACGMPFTSRSTASSTMACPVSVNCLGFQPKYCRYLPICCRDPKLNAGKSMRLNSPPTTSQLSPKNFRPTTDMAPSFLILGHTCFTKVGKGLKTSCTSSSRSYFFSLSSASKTKDFS